MRLPLTLTALALIAAAGSAQARPRETVEQLLAGRVAQKPVSCINLRDVRSSRIVEPGTIIYEEGAGRRWFVNSPGGGTCTALRRDRAIVTRTPGSRLCRGDIVRVIDPPSPVEFGSCGLDDFTPYVKEARAR